MNGLQELGGGGTEEDEYGWQEESLQWDCSLFDYGGSYTNQHM